MMEELTCPNCNVDVHSDELKKNGLRCPTCGFDMSESSGEKDEFDEDEDLEDEKEKDEDEPGPLPPMATWSVTIRTGMPW